MLSKTFPTTHRTWIGARLAVGDTGRAEVLRHVMEVYSEPLQAYCARTRLQSVEAPGDLVHGFFASWLPREDYLKRWEASGKRLHEWLIGGVHFHAKDVVRKKRGDVGVGGEADPLTSVESVGPGPLSAMWRAFKLSVVRSALREAAGQCARDGLDLHWKVFIGRVLERRSYQQIGAEHGFTAERAAVMARSARRRFVAGIRSILERDGVRPENLDRAVSELLEEG